MLQTYLAKRLFDGEQLHKQVAMQVVNGQIVNIGPQSGQDGIELEGLVAPGYVDVQVNGGGGVLFNQQPTLSSLKKMMAGHSLFGTTAMMPTLITDSINVMQEAADAIAGAQSQSLPGIVGVHFEGPHLSVPKRGIHPERQVRPISDAEMAIFTRKDLGQVIVTVAPENVSPDVIRDLVKQGVKVCLGHSNTDAETALKAVEAGADGFTHLYNAMSGLKGRDPGVLGAALYAEQAYCGLIADLLHVSELGCQLAYKIKGAKRLMLVTDAMAHVGSDLQDMDYLDTKIIRTGNKLTLPDGTIAGSALDMASAVRNMYGLGVSLVDSLRMATATPADYLGQRTLGRLASGSQADFVLLNNDLQVEGCWIAGTPAAQHFE